MNIYLAEYAILPLALVKNGMTGKTGIVGEALVKNRVTGKTGIVGEAYHVDVPGFINVGFIVIWFDLTVLTWINEQLTWVSSLFIYSLLPPTHTKNGQ